jgi:AraC-like DNA-binding protein
MGEDVTAFVELRPPAELAPFVESLWVHRLAGPPPPEGRRLMPDGRIHFVWAAGLGVRIAGPAQTYMTAAPLTDAIAYGVTFRPGAAPYLLRTAASEMVDVHVPLDAIDPRFAARLDQHVGETAADPRAGARALARELTRRVRDLAQPDPAVHAAVALLEHRPGATVADAAARACVSERELRRRFVQDVGYAPKTLQRVLRFQRFLGQLHVPHVELAGAAALAGYADQSHLSREARKLAGLSPKQLLGYRH